MCETRVSARTCARGSLRKCGSDASRSSGRVHSTRGLDSCGELARESRHKGGMPRRGRRVLRFALVGVLSSHFGLIDAFVGHQPKSEPPAAPELFVTTINGDGGPPIGLTPVGAPGTTTFTQVMLTDPLAVCNDGTQSAYYWAPGSGSSADIWVVYLEGAMFCWSKESCDDRYTAHQYYMSSKTWATQFAQGGIFATDGTSAWGSANRVYVKYCTSDLWSGDVAASPLTWNYNFRGSRIVPAVIADLIQNKGLGSAPAKLLFGGCSAGAIGAMNNLETVASLVPATVQVKGFLDGAGLLNMSPGAWTWSPELETLQQLMATLLTFSNAQFPSYCQSLFPNDLWKCLIGQYRMPLITTVPYFVNVPQFDMFELMYFTDNYEPATSQQMQYVEQFQLGTLALIATLPAGTGVFSPTCLVHCLSGQTPWSQLVVDGTTLAAALSSWYFNEQAVSVVSNCQGWNCVNNCGINLQTGLPCNMPGPACTPVQLQEDPTPNGWQEPPLLMPPWPVGNPPPMAPIATGGQELEIVASTKLSSLAALVRGSASPSPPPPPPSLATATAAGAAPGAVAVAPAAAMAAVGPAGAPPPLSQQAQQQAQQLAQQLALQAQQAAQQNGLGGSPPPPLTAATAAESSAAAGAEAPAEAPASALAAKAVPLGVPPTVKGAQASPSAALVQGGSASAESNKSDSFVSVARDLTGGILIAGTLAGAVLWGIGGGSGGGSAGEKVALLQKRGVAGTLEDNATAIATGIGIDVRRRPHDGPPSDSALHSSQQL